MESFVFSQMNKATRDKDFTKIEIFGPFASILGYIIQVAGLNHPEKLSRQFEVYRGMVRHEEDLEEFQLNNIVSLKGFTSTSLNKQVAINFLSEAINEPNKIAVLLQINFRGRH